MTSLGKYVTEHVKARVSEPPEGYIHPWACKEELCYHEYQHWLLEQKDQVWGWRTDEST